jgi:hypothetical protein
VADVAFSERSLAFRDFARLANEAGYPGKDARMESRCPSFELSGNALDVGRVHCAEHVSSLAEQTQRSLLVAQNLGETRVSRR